MKNVLVLLLVSTVASLASATPIYFESWEDGDKNLGGNDQVATLNTTAYPDAQPEVISDGEYGRAVKAYNYPTMYGVTIVDTAAKVGSNSAYLQNVNTRTDLKVTLAPNTVYTYSLWYMLDAADDSEQDKAFTLRMLAKDQGHNITFVDSLPLSITVANYGVWEQKSFTFNTAGYAYAGQEIQMRVMCSVSGNFLGGTSTSPGAAYIDGLMITPEPATLVILGLGGLMLGRRK